MPTIKDVAKRAGVSIATVSNILNGKTQKQGDAYARVLRAVHELNYHPNYSAKNLRKGQNKMIGVILPSLESPYNDIFKGISQALTNTSYYPVVKITQNNAYLEENEIRDLIEKGVAGLLCIPAATDFEESIYSELQNMQISTVLIERNLPDFESDKVLFDNKGIIEKETFYYSNKYEAEEIVLIRKEQPFSCEDDAQIGFRNRNKKGQILFADGNKDISFEQIMRIWAGRKTQNVKAVITTDIELARAAYEASSILGWNPQISALSGDQWQISSMYSGLKQIPREASLAGMNAVYLLINKIQDEGKSTAKTVVVSQVRENHLDSYPNVSWKKQTIRILGIDSNGLDSMELLSSRIQNNSALRFEFDRKRYNELSETVLNELRSGTCNYDLMTIDLPQVPYFASQGLIYPFEPDFVEDMKDRYPLSIRQAFFHNKSKIYGVPFVSGIQAIYYRKDVFNNKDIQDQFRHFSGHMLSVPQNWDEYVKIAEFFTKEFNPSSPFQWGTISSSINPIGLVDEFIPRQWAYGGRIVSKTGRPSMLSDYNIRALDNMKKCFECSDPAMFGKIKDETVFNQLLEGKVPIVFGFANHYRRSREEYQTYEQVIEVAKAPRGKGMLGSYMLCINSRSENIDLCKELIQWITSEKMSILSMRMNGCILTNAVLENSDLRTQFPWLNLVDETYNRGGIRELVRTAKGEIVDSNKVDIVIGNALKEALTTEKDSIQILRETDERLSDLL